MSKLYLTVTAIVLSVVVLFSSCASIVSKSIYPVSITQVPINDLVDATCEK